MRYVSILLLVLLGACGGTSPYRVDLGARDGDASASFDAPYVRYVIVDAKGVAFVQATDIRSGLVVWRKELPANTAGSWKRTGREFSAVTRAEAAAALGLPVTP